jgi:hypothetical protein
MEEQAPREPSLYIQLCAIDIITPILRIWQERKMSAGLDGKFRLHDEMNLARTWIIAKICPERSCGKWLSIYHRFYRILSPPCKDCWKVVMAPRTLTDLMEVQKLQEKLGWPAKAGLEQRDYTSGIGSYRAFWYCPFTKGLEGGRVHFKRVQKALEKHFGKEKIDWYLEHGLFYLKRGCTELERDFGPSDKWDLIDHSAKFDLLESVWETPNELEEEFSPLKYTNLKRWIEFATAYAKTSGDSTVVQCIGGKSLGVQLVTYHNSAHLDGDFKPSMKPFNGSIEAATPMEKDDGKAEAEEKQEDLFRFESK